MEYSRQLIFLCIELFARSQSKDFSCFVRSCDLSAEELSGEVARVRRALDAPRRGQRPGPREPGSFAGCLFVGVD